MKKSNKSKIIAPLLFISVILVVGIYIAVQPTQAEKRTSNNKITSSVSNSSSSDSNSKSSNSSKNSSSNSKSSSSSNSLNSSSSSSNKNSSTSNNSSFTNKFGTSTTKCAHSGCNNYIASSGDTNCCTIHSKKCKNCGCYIDEDAMYCITCLTKSASK